jgi:hypothetical protein
MARVRGSSRTAPPTRVVKDTDTIPPVADIATEELRTDRQLHRSAATLAGLSIQSRALIQDWETGPPSPGGNNDKTLFPHDNSQAMDFSRDDAEERWKQSHTMREELRAPAAATFAPMNGRFSEDDLPERRYEEHETRQSTNEVRSYIPPLLVRRGEMPQDGLCRG